MQVKTMLYMQPYNDELHIGNCTKALDGANRYSDSKGSKNVTIIYALNMGIFLAHRQRISNSEEG